MPRYIEQPFCPTCDTLLTRAALVSLGYRKAAVALHAALKHPGDWQDCTNDVCYRHRYEIQRAGYERSKGAARDG